MELFHWLVTFSLLLGRLLASAGRICQIFKFVIDEDVTPDHALEGHVFKTLTVDKVTDCHLMCRDDCRCISMNHKHYKERENCELNDVNKKMKPAALKYKPGERYYDLVREYKVDGRNFVQGRDHCRNRCCQSNPCLQGGTCQEICDPTAIRFNCTCPDEHTGQRCEKIKHPRSCKDLATNGVKTSGMHFLYDSQDDRFPVYCDFDSEEGFVWALVQSFALANNNMFKGYRFGADHPVNEGDGMFNWNAYRLSLSRMRSIAGASTHMRATCNFPDDGLLYTDYARAKLEGHDLFGVWSAQCRQYEFINIRGNECRDCTAATWQAENEAWHLNSNPVNYILDCEFDASQGAVNLETNFGLYYSNNGNFRCTSFPSSTTQHWIGSKRNYEGSF